jgi:hypothetical protein
MVFDQGSNHLKDEDAASAENNPPDWLEQCRPSPTGRIALPMWRLWKKSESLLPSGLLGPVKIYASGTVPTK